MRVEVIRALTDGRGADVCADAVGMEAERGFLDRIKAIVHVEKGTDKVMENCIKAVRHGGVVSVSTVHPLTIFLCIVSLTNGLRFE